MGNPARRATGPARRVKGCSAHTTEGEYELFSGSCVGRGDESASNPLHNARSSQVHIRVVRATPQPAVAGKILGVLIGPNLLNLAAPSEITSVLAEIGVIFLLFNVGLETKPAAIVRVGKSAALVAVLGVYFLSLVAGC